MSTDAETEAIDQAEIEARSAEFESAPAGKVIAWTLERFGGSVSLACSFQDCVVLDIAVRVDPAIEVVFLDTGFHFPETLAFVEDVRLRFDLNLKVVTPGPEADDWPCGTERCCELRKVAPLNRALAGRRAWLTGLKRDDAATRSDAPIVAWDAARGMVKVNPMATWTDDDIARYLADHDLPVHPLGGPGLSLHRLRADDAVRWLRAKTRAPAGGAAWTRPNAACIPDMARNRNRDNPYGVEFRGNERAMRFVHPYRTIGELNQIERWKLDRHPLEVADAIIENYSKQGPGAIAKVPGEQERLKWVGLYPQKQGGDAYMLRVKVPGGILTADQAREIGIVADAFGEGPDDSAVFGNRYADITTRQDIQIHWLRMADIPRIWQRFADVGITTIQACGDSARNVLCCPVSGVDAEEAFNALPAAQAISDFFTGNREYANLPRKFKISVTGCLEDCAQAEINDIGLWPARAADGALGFNVLAGGGLSDGERMASDIDVFIAVDQAVELTRAIAQLFGELGNRENRGMARMRYLVQELGAEGFRAELAARTRFALVPAGEDLTRRYRGDHVGVHPQSEPGLMYVGCSVPVGRMSGIELVEAARLGPHLRRRHAAARHRSELRPHRCSRRACRRIVGRGAPPEVLALPGTVRAGRGGLHGERVLPLRRGGDEGARREMGALARLPDRGRSGPRGGTRRRGPMPGSSACTSRAARRRVRNRRSPTSAFGARRPMSTSASSRPSTSAWAARSAPMPRSSTGWKGRGPSTTCPKRSCEWCAATGTNGGRTSPSTTGPGVHPTTSFGPCWPGSPRSRTGGRIMKGVLASRRDERGRGTSGQDVVLGARSGRDLRRPLHPVRDVRGGVPFELHRHRRGHRPACAW